MDKIIVYSMVGCPYCTELKDLLDDSGIDYIERDVKKYEEEWEVIMGETNNEFIPTVIIANEETGEGKVLIPDIDFDDIPDCFTKIVDYITR
jgi:glutaredoxin